MGNRRINGRHNHIATILIVIVVMCILFTTILFAGIGPFKPRYSQVYALAYNYGETGNVVIRGGYVFSEDAPESYFAKGLTGFSEDKIEEAHKYFLKALEVIDSHTDEALPFYLYCYLNNTELLINEKPNEDYVKKAVAAAIDYSPAADDHYHVWSAIHSVSLGDDGKLAIKLLSDILSNVPELSFDAKIRYNNCIAMMDFLNSNYARSIRRFYDVYGMLEGRHLNDFLVGQKLFTGTYIGLFFYEFGEYDEAIEIFKRNIETPVKNPQINANRKSTDYVNLASACIDIKDPKNALKVCDEMEGLIEDVDSEVKYSIKAAVLENRARACILLKDYTNARKYIEEEEELLAISNKDAYYGSDEFLELAKGELECATGNCQEAISIFEKLLLSENIEYAGIVEDVYEHLLESYKSIGDEKSYLETKDKLYEYEKTVSDTVKRECIEFTKYYAEFDALAKANENLETRERVSNTLIIMMIIILILASIYGFFLNKSTYVDPLTGVKNRKLLHKYASKNQESGISEKTCIIMLDVDYFKNYNDTYGHLKGDEALKQVATALRKSFRKKDFLIRYGGEEFLVIIDKMDALTVTSICERVLQSIRNEAIPNKASKVSDVLTVSLGICINNSQGTPLETLLSEADHALYDAKNGGRNRVSLREYNG